MAARVCKPFCKVFGAAARAPVAAGSVGKAGPEIERSFYFADFPRPAASTTVTFLGDAD
jgi:hypothetical protein